MRPLQRVSDSSWIALGLFLMAVSCFSSVEERQDGTNKQFEVISSTKGTDWDSRPAQMNQRVTVSAARTGGSSEEADDKRGGKAGFGQSRVKNKGPNCFAVVYSPPAVDPETCTTVCMKLWKLYMKTYQECDDVDKCFYRDLKSSASYLDFHTRAGLSTAVKTLKRCSFATRDQDAPLAQYQHEDIIITTHRGSDPAEWPLVCPKHTAVTIVQALMKYTEESTAGHDVSCPPWDAHADLNEECKSTWPYASNYCILTSKAWKKASAHNPCGRVRDLRLTLRYSCQLQVLKDRDACRLDNSQGTTHGACRCPGERVLCTVEQAEANLGWSRSLYWLDEPAVAAHFLVMVHKKLQLQQKVPCTTSRILCKKPDPPGPLPGLSPIKGWTNRGPNCYQPLDKTTAELCTFACNILWNKVEDMATSQSDPFGWFLDMWIKASFGDMTEFDGSVQTTLTACSFEERDLLAPARQYEFEKWDTQGQFRNPCGQGKALDLVQVLVGCPAVLKDRNIKDCNYLDKTSEAATECASIRTVVDGVCQLGNFERSREVCPNCPGDIVFVWRWNCDYVSAAPHKDFTCTIREPAEASGVNSEEHPCACQNRATPCSLDEAKADMSWTQNRTKGTIQLLSGGFAYTSDLTGPHFKALYPSRQLCSQHSTQVLCKESIIETYPAPQLTSPDCALAFSKTAEASPFDHVVCSSACVRVLREICKGVPSRWLCVLQYIPKDCFVPPMDNKSCVLSVAVGSYSKQDRSCMCPDGTRPCTAEEARATRWQWERQENKVSTKLLHVAGGMALWPGGRLIPEYGLDTPTACADNKRYAGILCYGPGPSIGQLGDVKTADCEGTLPLEESTTTREQCNYACSVVKKACEQAVAAKPGLHRTVAECISKKLPTTRWLQDCYLTWKVLEPFKDAVMEMGLLVATESWTPVKFQRRMKSPVVVLSVPVASTVLGSTQIRNVQEDGFEVRYKTAICGEDYVLPYTTTAWMALPTDRYAMKPFVAVRVDRVSVIGNRHVTLDYIVSMKAPQPILLVQIQETNYEMDGEETLPIAVVDNISQTQANVRVASLHPLPPETVSTIGYVLIDHNEICANVLGCKLSRFKVETAVLQPEYGNELPVFRGSVEGTQPMIFASLLQTGSFPIYHLMQTKQSNITTAGRSNSTTAKRRSRSMPAPIWLQETTKPQSLLRGEQRDFSGAATAAQHSTAPAPKGSQQRWRHYNATTAAVSPATGLEAQLTAPSRKRVREEEVTGLLQRAHEPDVTSDSKQTIEQTEHPISLETGHSTHRQSRRDLSPLEAPGEDDPMWNIVVDTVLDNRCLPNSVLRQRHFSRSQRPLMGILYVKAGFPTMSSEKKLNYYPDCVNASFKKLSSGREDQYCMHQCEQAEQVCAGAEDGMWRCVLRTLSDDVKKSCHINYRAITEPTYAAPVDPPVDPLANCMIVDMEAIKDQSERGWDMSTHSCNCPKGLSACPVTQVMYDWSSWVRSLFQGGKLCPTQTTVVKPVATHFRIPKTSLCDSSVKSGNDVVWEQLRPPPYSAEDVVLADETVRSGAYQCRHDIRYVFCQGAEESKSTTTTTPPPLAWPQDRDCIPGEWGSWGPCSAICIGERTSVPVKKRRRHIVLEHSGAGRQCVLEMQTDCTVPWDVDYCENTCWKAEWGAWSDCTKTTWSVGNEPQLARARLRHIFYSGNAECANENLIQKDTSSCNDVQQVETSPGLRAEGEVGRISSPAERTVRSVSQAGASQPSPVSVSELEQTTAVSKDPSCSLVSSWSSCTTPCWRADYPDPAQYRVWLRPVEKNQNKYCAFEQQRCVDLTTPCAEEKIDCAKITAAYPVPDEIFACQKSCQIASQRCMQNVLVPGLSHLECVLSALQWEMLQNARHCVYEPEATRWVLGTLSTCFLTGTQLASTTEEFPYVRTTAADGKGSCVCAVENSVPCSLQEVFETLRASPEILTNTTCPAQELGALFTEENPAGSADSAIFFAASNMGRVHCPLSASSTQTAALPTYSSFSTLKELNAYCEHGLPTFNQIREVRETYLAATCDEKITSKHKEGFTRQQCVDLCRSLIEPCKAETLHFLECAKEILRKHEFANNCEAPQWKTLGRGLIFCKHVPKNCRFSPWSEWTPCGATCKETPGPFTDVYRSRQRTLLSPSEYLGVCWDASGSRTFDMEFCTWLPPCSEGDNSLPPVIGPPTSHDVNALRPPLDKKTTCLVVDMSNYSEGRAYSAQYDSCLCPDGSRSCTSKEVMDVIPKADLQRVICSGAYHKNVYAQDGLKFECASGVFTPYHFSADPKADCQDYVDFLFCEVDPLSPGKQPSWVPVCMLLLGVTTGMVVSLSCVQYSGDMQAALGFTGKYVELTQQYEEMTAPKATDAVTTAPETARGEKTQAAGDTAEMTNEIISGGRRES